MPPKRDPSVGRSESQPGDNPGRNKGHKNRMKHQQQQHQSRSGNDQQSMSRSGSISNLSTTSSNSVADLGQNFYEQMNVNPPQWQDARERPPPQNVRPQQLVKDGISSDEVQAALECPVCYEVLRPPIYNCQTGHPVCNKCKVRVPECPLCRKGYTDARNYIAEQIAETCVFKCQYADQGCEGMLKLTEEDRHINNCNFRPLGCEVFPCSRDTIIPFKNYLPHLRTKHHSRFAPVDQNNNSREVCVRKPQRLMHQGYRPPFVMNCHGNSFLQYTQAVGDKMWFWVSLYGTPEEASRYKVKLTLWARDKDLRNTWQGPVHSVRHSGDDIYHNGLCMVMTATCLQSYFHAHPEGFPCYNVDILIEKTR